MFFFVLFFIQLLFLLSAELRWIYQRSVRTESLIKHYEFVRPKYYFRYLASFVTYTGGHQWVIRRAPVTPRRLTTRVRVDIRVHLLAFQYDLFITIYYWFFFSFFLTTVCPTNILSSNTSMIVSYRYGVKNKIKNRFRVSKFHDKQTLHVFFF